MKRFFIISSVLIVNIISAQAQDQLELETTFIKGNKELPQILYVVPWQDIKRSQKKEQQIILYSLFGDLFEPIDPDEMNHEIMSNK